MLVDATECARLTERQVRRDVVRMQENFDLFDHGFREVVHRWRLTAAVLLLSAPNLSATEVAGAVGYGSLTAMGRAFKQAHLPSPSQVRRMLTEPR
jgi:AraC-like DNA-binding protein